MVKTTIVSLVRGNTTNAAIVGSSFSLLANGDTGITINASTGAITADVAPGVYTLKVQNAENSIGNSVSYVTLTVLDIPLATARSPRFLQLFTDNSRVYYKRGSNAFCGVGSVRNFRTKGFKT